MIDNVFIAILFIAFILMILAVEKKSVIYSSLSFLMWIIIFASSLYIQVPGIDEYSDFTINIVCIGFIIVNVVWIVYLVMEFRTTDKY